MNGQVVRVDTVFKSTNRSAYAKINDLDPPEIQIGSPMALLHIHPLICPLFPVLTLYFRPRKLALPVIGFTLAFCPNVGAEISLRPLTPSNICFLGVAWPLAILFALPRLYSIILSAASRSNGSPSNAAAVEGVGGIFSASPTAQSGSVGIENGLSGFEIGVN